MGLGAVSPSSSLQSSGRSELSPFLSAAAAAAAAAATAATTAATATTTTAAIAAAATAAAATAAAGRGAAADGSEGVYVCAAVCLGVAFKDNLH